MQHSHSVQSCCQFKKELEFLTKIGTDRRLIVVHTGGQEGLV